MSRKISLKNAFLYLFLGIILLILAIFIFIYGKDYNFLFKEQGKKISKEISEKTKIEIKNFLIEPSRLNYILRSVIEEKEIYDKENLESIEKYEKLFLKEVDNNLDQIGTLSYGNEAGNFIGIRFNKDSHNNLMVKDKRTENVLTIYEKNTTDSKVLASYSDYNLNIRPWYAPIKENPKPSWSKVYANYDEKMELTISHMLPVFNNNGGFEGVSVIDIKLNNINNFLRKNTRNNSNVIYMVDGNWNIIAHSTSEEIIINKKNISENFTTKKAYEVKNNLISNSAEYIKNNNMKYDISKKISYADERAFIMVNPLDSISNLEWKIIVAIPEKDLMGPVKERHNLTIIIILFIIFLVSLISVFYINKLVNPIISISKTASNIAEGNLDAELKKDKVYTYEINNLIRAFEDMTTNLKKSFTKIKKSEEKYRRLFENKSDELKEVMDELIEKEKLASLGSLVAGISHEINTPLGVAISAMSLIESKNKKIIDLLEKGEMSKEDFIDYIETMDESIKILDTNLNRAAELVKSFKSISVDQNAENLKEFNFCKYINNTILSLKHEYKNKGHEFIVNCPQDLVIESYPGVFAQIFTNLIMNSITHGFADEKNGVIKIDISYKNENLNIIYSDNGKGMTEEVKEKMYEPFFTTSRNNGGSGLGMNIVYNLVTEKLGGKITCESTVNEGTKFIIYIDLSKGGNNDGKKEFRRN